MIQGLNYGGEEIYLACKMSRLALGPIQSPVKLVLWALSMGC